MKYSKFLLIAALALAPALGFSQQIASYAQPEAPFADAPADSRTVVAPKSQAATDATPAWETKFDRWVDLDTFNYAARYRSTFDDNGARSFDQGQQRLLAHGKFKFDKDGRYGIGFHLSSGRYFNWAYADFIGGGQHQFVQDTEAKMTPYQYYVMTVLPPDAGFYNSGGGQLYLRQFFLTAEPIRGFEFQFGGLAINHGVNSEATSYDDDGYMTGERVVVRRPKQIWLSEVSYTRGYLGDLYTPNFFARGQTLSKSNYWQFLGQKNFGKRVSVSADYTYSAPVGASFFLKTTREGIAGDVHQSKVVDKVRFEAYQRINGGLYGPGIPFYPGKGYALTLSRNFKKRLSLEAGIASIDISYISNMGLNVQALELGLTVNGDQYGIGKRYFVRPTIPLTRGVSLAGSYSHLFDTNNLSLGEPIDIWNAQALTAGLVFDVKKGLFHKKDEN